MAVLSAPVVLSKSAAAPNGRIVVSGVEAEALPAPTPVLKLPVRDAKERKPTNCCVRSAGGEAN